MRDASTYRPLLLGLVAAFFWGTHSTIVRFLSADIAGITSATIRLYIAALTLFIVLRIVGHRPTLDLKTKGLIPVVLALAANFAFFHIGLQYASATSAILLENTAPVFVLLILALGFRESPTFFEVVATLIVVVGAYLTVLSDFDLGSDFIVGDAIEVFAGLTWAAFLVAASKSTSDDQSPLDRVNFMLVAFVGAAVLMTPFAAFALPSELTGLDILLLVLLGIFPTAIAYVLWYEAAAQVSTVLASLLFALTVIFTFANAAIFLDEPITGGMIVGGILIVGGVMLAKIKGSGS
ncbi:DMT family transporter [Bauldia sp.]|uniref:DMT family transporter n=1 Tax=Bauldia sp. TaxID=2575872 RepID=UPI003BADA9AE